MGVGPNGEYHFSGRQIAFKIGSHSETKVSSHSLNSCMSGGAGHTTMRQAAIHWQATCKVHADAANHVHSHMRHVRLTTAEYGSDVSCQTLEFMYIGARDIIARITPAINSTASSSRSPAPPL